MEQFFQKLPWVIIIVLCLTLGLAPYHPPHIWEKFQMLVRGHLHRPIDWFDFFLHALPWCMLIVKSYYSVR